MKKVSFPIDVYEDGSVFFEGKNCTTQRDPKGYNTIRMALHRLVASAFHGPAPAKHVCHHKDGNPRNNRADNLCWVTQAENVRLHFAGRPRKLNPKQVLDILAKKPERTETLQDLADAFGVSYSAVRAIRSGINWSKGYKPSNRAILTEAQVKRIREWVQQPITAAMLARKYHVSDVTILNIWHGRF